MQITTKTINEGGSNPQEVKFVDITPTPLKREVRADTYLTQLKKEQLVLQAKLTKLTSDIKSLEDAGIKEVVSTIIK